MGSRTTGTEKDMKAFFKVTAPEKIIAMRADSPPVGTETVPLDQAHGRMLAQDLVACENLPASIRATMDGYALKASSSFGANEEFTHMAVAELSGAADTGLGIFAAAKALGLDFIPEVTERYDLIIPETYYHWEPIQTLLDIIRSDEFKRRVRDLGGYHTDKTGELVAGSESG
ncbi:MAG: hypothetical protein CSB33_05600 [Desulfobacterales bacterium]|nr:MAG: hypothetical protein CSB33_05600 [Desulfobacterales bacterium]